MPKIKVRIRADFEYIIETDGDLLDIIGDIYLGSNYIPETFELISSERIIGE